jgi:DNA-binding winged helix-turn-helix (wHTH) protein
MKYESSSFKVLNEETVQFKNDGHDIFLEPRLSKLFYHLYHNLDDLMSKDDLNEKMWSDTIVNDESLARAVADLRKKISDHNLMSLKIITIPKRGYKMVELENNPSIWNRILKRTIYTVALITLIILVIRGLNY